jgi:hypothetical protein
VIVLFALLLPIPLHAAGASPEGEEPLQDSGYILRSSVISSAGSHGASGEFQSDGTAGQTGIGIGEAGDQAVSGGFWRSWLDWISDASDPSSQAFCTVLFRNHPNPFREETVISYSLAAAGPVEITVFDINGRTVRTLADGRAEPGQHSLIWNGRDDSGSPVSSGIYFCRLRAESHVSLNKMLILN